MCPSNSSSSCRFRGEYLMIGWIVKNIWGCRPISSIRKHIAPEYSTEEWDINTNDTVFNYWLLYWYFTSEKLWPNPQSSNIFTSLFRINKCDDPPSWLRDIMVWTVIFIPPLIYYFLSNYYINVYLFFFYWINLNDALLVLHGGPMIERKGQEQWQ